MPGAKAYPRRFAEKNILRLKGKESWEQLWSSKATEVTEKSSELGDRIVSVLEV